MAYRYSRAEVTGQLAAQVSAGKSIIMFGAGLGLTARCADIGGADLIAVYSTAIYRMRGLSTILAFLPYSHANGETLRMAGEILPVVQRAPCIAGVGAHDPALDTEAALDAYLDRLVGMGFSGVTNEPFAGIYGPAFAAQLEAAGRGFSREAEMIRRARERDIFTFGWAFSPEEARRMAEAGADVIGAIVGVTAGGQTGAGRAASLEDACVEVREMVDAARQVNPGAMVMTHGGPFKDPETARRSLEGTGAVGYAAGSSGERIPTESAVIETTRAYKDIAVFQ
jgi:predicted TIM-barrel enzyme